MNSPYYNIYTENDEEVTTLISRLSVARSRNVALIIPQNSLVLQSMINLLLLSREARKQQKDITIVTQDEEGIAFASRVGIKTIPLAQWKEISQGRDPLAFDEAQSTERNHNEGDYSYANDDVALSGVDAVNSPSGKAATRESLGSSDTFFTPHESAAPGPMGQVSARESQHPGGRSKNDPRLGAQSAREKLDQITGNEASQMGRRPEMSQGSTRDSEVDRQYSAQSLRSLQRGSSRKNSTDGDVAVNVDRSGEKRRRGLGSRRNSATASHTDKNTKTASAARSSRDVGGSHAKSTKGSFFSRFFSSNGGASQEISDAPLRSARYIGWGVSAVILLIVVGFVFLPLSLVNVRIADTIFDKQLDIAARASTADLDASRREIPLRVIEKEISRTLTTEATGTDDVDPQKAYGTLTIYNTFGEGVENFVASTRFESPDGQIFRITEAVEIPGMTVNGDEVVPGVVEVTVVADEPSTEGNVEPGTWTIPGLEVNPDKFEKIYAESEEAMTGGSEGGEGLSVVTEEDLAALQEQALSAADVSSEENLAYYRDQMQEFVRENEVILDSALTVVIKRSEPLTLEGTAVSDAEFVVGATVTVLVVDENHVKGVLSQAITAEEGVDIDLNEIDVAYQGVRPDFDDEKLDFRATVSINTENDIDQDAFVKLIAGVNHSEMKDLLRDNYPFVNNIEITTYPPFPAMIGENFSRFPFMTKINVQKDAQEGE